MIISEKLVRFWRKNHLDLHVLKSFIKSYNAEKNLKVYHNREVKTKEQNP